MLEQMQSFYVAVFFSYDESDEILVLGKVFSPDKTLLF